MSLLASALAYSLISVINRDIGLKFVSGDLPGLSSVTIVACTFSEGTVPPAIAWLNAEHRSGVKVDWYNLRYSLENRSGPGELPLGSDLMTGPWMTFHFGKWEVHCESE